uniref:hypothetical protein n=1 Tax=Escherichia coli TaxID=562 RepID=UPI001F2E4BFC|nr:hypothetical protein [Escherichia coli]UGK56763.1 hypothetical protein [Escherichia coli]
MVLNPSLLPNASSGPATPTLWPAVRFWYLLLRQIKTQFLKKLNDATSRSDVMSKRFESYLSNDRLKVNTDSTKKGPSNEIAKPRDELAPVRQLKAIRPELVQTPIFQPIVAFYERLA